MSILSFSVQEKLVAVMRTPAGRWMVCVFFLALIPRLLWALPPHPLPFSDMEDYYLCATNFLKGDHLAQAPDRLAYRAPLYPLFLAACIRLFPADPLLAIRLIQAILDSLNTVLVMILAGKIIQAWIEKIAVTSLERYRIHVSFILAALYSFSAYPIFFSSILMTETLFIFLLLIWILWGMSLSRPASWVQLSGFSCWLGFMALTRPIALFFFPVLIWKIFSCLPSEKWLRTSWLPLTAWLIPIAPWTIRNYVLLHAFVLISSNSGVNLFIGNNPTFGYYDGGAKEVVRREYIQKYGPSEVGEDRLLMRLGWDYIRQEPRAALNRCGWKFYFLYLLDKEPWPWEEYHRGEGIRFLGNVYFPVIRWQPWFFWLALWGMLYASWKRLPYGIPLGVIAFYTLSCLIFFARSRFRLPLEPLLIVYMGLAVLSLVELILCGYGRLSKNHQEGCGVDEQGAP